MIPVQGLTGAKVAILGLGRSGLSAARALAAGGAVPICWDDNPAARAAATTCSSCIMCVTCPFFRGHS